MMSLPSSSSSAATPAEDQQQQQPRERRPLLELVVVLCSFALVVQGVYIARLRARESTMFARAFPHDGIVAHRLPPLPPDFDAMAGGVGGGAHDDYSSSSTNENDIAATVPPLPLDGDGSARAVAVVDGGGVGAPAREEESGYANNNADNNNNNNRPVQHLNNKKEQKRLRGTYDGATNLRLVFLHVRKTGGSTAWALLRKLLPPRFRDGCLCGIKSPPMYEAKCEGLARSEARNSSSSPGHTQFFVEQSDLDGSGGMDHALEAAGYDAAWVAGLSKHARAVMRKNAAAASQVFRALEAECPIVELHHWDMSVAALFRAHGYRIITFVRDPLARLASSYNYEFITAPKNNDRLAQLSSDPALLAVERERFRDWLLRQNTPQETLRMVSGCYVNVLDTFQAQRWVAARQGPAAAARLAKWLPPGQSGGSGGGGGRGGGGGGGGGGGDDGVSRNSNDHTHNSSANTSSRSSSSSSRRWGLWESTLAHRVHVASLDPGLCQLNPTFDGGDQSGFRPEAVAAVVHQAEAALRPPSVAGAAARQGAGATTAGGGGLDFIGVQERWDESLGLLSSMFGIPRHLLDAAKKVNARHHLLEIGDVLTEVEQGVLAAQLRADTDFYRALVQRFEHDLLLHSDGDRGSSGGSSATA